MNQHRGHCRCEGVVILVHGEPEASVYCHCDDCRRSSGAPLIAAAGFRKKNVTWEASDTLAEYVSGTCTRLFCQRCGSPVAQCHESAADMIFFNTGFMDEPEKFPPTFHSFEGMQLSWLALNDTLPRYETTKIIKAN